MIEALFIFTAVMVITALFKFVGLVFGNSINLPYIIPYTNITPGHYLVWYPSLAFQVWFWTEQLGVFA